MYRSLYFKIIMLFAVFMTTVMAVVGTVLLNSVFRFYTSEFENQMEQYFYTDKTLKNELSAVIDQPKTQKDILEAYGTTLGIDVYRNYYILDMNGDFVDGSNEELGNSLIKTPNILNAMNGKDGKSQILGSDYSDYAVYMSGKNGDCIIYIKDTQEEMRQLSWQLFSLILQSVFFGLIIAVVLSFFLAKAITSPIQNLTRGAQLITAGEFTHEIDDAHAKDEIGVLTTTFNRMKQTLKNTLDEVMGERQKLETVLSYLKDCVIAFSDNGEIIHINKSAVSLFKKNYDKNFNLDVMLHLLCIEYAVNYLSKLNNEKSLILREIVYEDKALDISISPLKYIDGNKSHNGIITVIHDVTGRYELDKARREFVANVSHELRTPLTVIKSSIETILMYPNIDKDMREMFLNSAVEESDRMLRIVGDLLALSRLDNNKTKWQIKSFDVGMSVGHLCDILKADASSHGHMISFNKQNNLPYITGDKERIEQAVINIISNAIKYTQNNGKINVSVSSGEEDVNIKIQDNGIGIPDEDIPRLFERFYRVEKSRTSDTGGTGLGLAIAKEIVNSHGGDITVQSKVGIGTTFIIRLPIETKLTNED